MNSGQFLVAFYTLGSSKINLVFMMFERFLASHKVVSVLLSITQNRLFRLNEFKSTRFAMLMAFIKRIVFISLTYEDHKCSTKEKFSLSLSLFAESPVSGFVLSVGLNNKALWASRGILPCLLPFVRETGRIM